MGTVKIQEVSEWRRLGRMKRMKVKYPRGDCGREGGQYHFELYNWRTTPILASIRSSDTRTALLHNFSKVIKSASARSKENEFPTPNKKTDNEKKVIKLLLLCNIYDFNFLIIYTKFRNDIYFKTLFPIFDKLFQQINFLYFFLNFI